MRRRTYTNDEFIEAVRDSYSVSQVLIKLKLKPTGGNYKVFHKRVKDLKLDVSHFTGQGHLKGKIHNYIPKRKIEDILVENSDYQSHKLRIRLLEEGYKEHKCEFCGLEEWMGQKISLELDHINGVNTDNRIENLRLLCPNCHSLTPTYRGKNKNETKRKVSKKKCISCDNTVSYKSKTGICSKCYQDSVKSKVNFTKEELEKELSNSSMSSVARKHKVSLTTIRRWVNKFDL